MTKVPPAPPQKLSRNEGPRWVRSFFLTKSGWYDIMDVQTEIRRMISALHNLDRKNAKKIEKATKTINENKKKLSKH